MYVQEGVNPPVSDGEIISAILNASRYKVDQWKDISVQQSLTQTSTEKPPLDGQTESNNPRQEECNDESKEQLQSDLKQSINARERSCTNVQRAQTSSIMLLKEHVLSASRLMSTFCYQLYTERDIQLHQIPLGGGSPKLAGRKPEEVML